MSQINLNLTIEEVNFILQTIGQLPTSSGAFPLLLNIKSQADKQIGEGKDDANVTS